MTYILMEKCMHRFESTYHVRLEANLWKSGNSQYLVVESCMTRSKTRNQSTCSFTSKGMPQDTIVGWGKNLKNCLMLSGKLIGRSFFGEKMIIQRTLPHFAALLNADFGLVGWKPHPARCTKVFFDGYADVKLREKIRLDIFEARYARRSGYGLSKSRFNSV